MMKTICKYVPPMHICKYFLYVRLFFVKGQFETFYGKAFELFKDCTQALFILFLRPYTTLSAHTSMFLIIAGEWIAIQRTRL